LAIAKEFVAEGAIVIVTGLEQEPLDRTVREIGPHSFGARADASNLAEMDRLLKDVKAKHGRLAALSAANLSFGHSALQRSQSGPPLHL